MEDVQIVLSSPLRANAADVSVLTAIVGGMAGVHADRAGRKALRINLGEADPPGGAAGRSARAKRTFHA